MVPVWTTFSDLFKVTIIQRQITWKWYSIQLYLQLPTNRKSYMIYRMTPFSMTLNDPIFSFKVAPFFDAEYFINSSTYRHSFNEILIGTYRRPTQQCHFEWSWVSDLEWLSKIFNDTKRRAVSLRQLSFLLERLRRCSLEIPHGWIVVVSKWWNPWARLCLCLPVRPFVTLVNSIETAT